MLLWELCGLKPFLFQGDPDRHRDDERSKLAVLMYCLTSVYSCEIYGFKPFRIWEESGIRRNDAR